MTRDIYLPFLIFRVLLDDLSDIIKASNGSETWRNLVTYKNMLRAIESMAVEMSFGIIFIGNGKLSTADFARFIESHKVSQDDTTVSNDKLASCREK